MYILLSFALLSQSVLFNMILKIDYEKNRKHILHMKKEDLCQKLNIIYKK